MSKWFLPAAVLCGALFAYSPILTANAPYEATMGLVQKIFYVHLPSAFMFLGGALVAGYASARYLITGDAKHDRLAFSAAELTVLFGLLTLVTGPLWARKSWGVWWQWDARVTSSLVGWMVSVAYLILRRYGGPGSEKLAAGLALFGMANVPFIYVSVNYWRTIHPPTSVIPTLPASMGLPMWFNVAVFTLMFVLFLRLRVRLEEQRTRLDSLYLSVDQ
jgi:heme exporter protein C